MVVSSAAPRPFPGYVGDHKSRALIVNWKYVEVVAANFQAGFVHSADVEVREIPEAARQQRLLDLPGNAEFALDALTLALMLHQARVIEDAGALDGDGVQDLAVELGECRRPARIEIQHAEELPALHAHDGLRRVGAGHGVERDRHHRAQALRDNALRALQLCIRLLQVACDDTRLLLQRHPDRGLAGRK